MSDKKINNSCILIPKEIKFFAISPSNNSFIAMLTLARIRLVLKNFLYPCALLTAFLSDPFFRCCSSIECVT